MFIKHLLLAGVLFSVTASPFPAEAVAPSDATDRSEIQTLFTQWEKDYNSGNLSATCSVFAPDLIVRGANLPDKDFEAMCAHLKDQMQRRDVAFKYVGLDIEEILISGDLAVVRAVLTYTLTDLKSKEKSQFKEIELDVLKRQEDGKWKISISYTWEKPV
jgi:uncharacterized protein (TIGR02246 family)